MSIKRLSPMVVPCMTIGSLPESYFETLSYYESLCWIYKYLKDTVIPAINNNAEALESLQTILDDIEEYIQNYDQDIAEINSKILILQTNISNNASAIANLTGKVNANYTDLQNQINAIEIGDIDVYNPLSGQYENINKVLEDMYDAMRNNAITATEFDALELTATAFDAYEITAYDFDLQAKSILV